MRRRKLKARYPGTCLECRKAVEPGDSIYWAGRGRVWHVDCKQAALRHTVCTSCGGAGCHWNNVPCRSCDGTGSRAVQEFASTPNPHPVDPMGVDLAFEDDCARRCGL